MQLRRAGLTLEIPTKIYTQVYVVKRIDGTLEGIGEYKDSSKHSFTVVLNGKERTFGHYNYLFECKAAVDLEVRYRFLRERLKLLSHTVYVKAGQIPEDLLVNVETQLDALELCLADALKHSRSLLIACHVYPKGNTNEERVKQLRTEVLRSLKSNVY